MNEVSAAPLVSVIMIFWNAETFMDEAIRSVVDQTHEAVELLLCDDGSTDASTTLAEEWAYRHPKRIRYLEHPRHDHRGMSATRNLGISASHGDLVAFLDADDVWRSDHLQRQIACLRSRSEPTAVCGVALDWHSWQPTSVEDVWSSLPYDPGSVVLPPRMLSAVLQEGRYATPMCSLLIERSVLLELGGFEDAFTGMYDDQVLLARLYLTQPVVLSDARTAYYRQHAGSSTAQAIRQGSYHPVSANVSREAFLHWLDQQPQLQAVMEPDLAQAMRSAIRPYATRSSRLRWRLLVSTQRFRQALHGRARRAVRRLVDLGRHPLDHQRKAEDKKPL